MREKCSRKIVLALVAGLAAVQPSAASPFAPLLERLGHGGRVEAEGVMRLSEPRLALPFVAIEGRELDLVPVDAAGLLHLEFRDARLRPGPASPLVGRLEADRLRLSLDAGALAVLLAPAPAPCLSSGRLAAEAEGLRGTVARDEGLAHGLEADSLRLSLRDGGPGAGCRIEVELSLRGAAIEREDRARLSAERLDLAAAGPGGLSALLQGAPRDVAAKISGGGLSFSASGGASALRVRSFETEAETDLVSAAPLLAALLAARRGDLEADGSRAWNAALALVARLVFRAEDLAVAPPNLLPTEIGVPLRDAGLGNVIGDHVLVARAEAGDVEIAVDSRSLGVAETSFRARGRLAPGFDGVLEVMEIDHADLGLLAAVEAIGGAPASVLLTRQLQREDLGAPRAVAGELVSGLARLLRDSILAPPARLRIANPRGLSLADLRRLAETAPAEALSALEVALDAGPR